MKMEIDSTIASVLIVIGVLGAGLFLEDIKIISLGAIALLVLLIAVKVIYFELPVILAMVALTIIAIYGDELTGLISKTGLKVEDVIDITEPSNEEERKFINEVKAAYAEQYAGNGQVITTDVKYAKKLFESAGITKEFVRDWLPDAYPIIFIGGADRIEKIVIADDKPLAADAQARELIRNRRIWVKVKIGDRDNIWVKVKAYVGKKPSFSVVKTAAGAGVLYAIPIISNILIPITAAGGYAAYCEELGRFDGAVWNVDISAFNNIPLYEEFDINRLTEPDTLEGPGGITAKKASVRSHYWNYDIAEV